MSAAALGAGAVAAALAWTPIFAFGLPDEDVHTPNEFFHLSSVPLGLEAWVLLLDELGRIDPAAFATSE